MASALGPGRGRRKALADAPDLRHPAAMEPEPFETVAFAFRPAQVAVILSMFQYYGIPAYAKTPGTAA
jgi:hypothetical protein